MDIKKLSEELPREAVHWRVQGQPYNRNGSFSAMALAYIDARDVMDRLDHVCGPENWQDAYTETAKGRVICTLSIRCGDIWVSKSDGAGETAVEGEKGGISDALKRAAVKWGIGRYLYRLDSPWVPCEVKQKGDKTYWKKWTVDPWTRVKSFPTVGQAQSAGEKIEDKTPEPSVDVKRRDWFLSNITKAPDVDTLNAWYRRPNVEEAFEALPEPMQMQVRKAYSDRIESFPAANDSHEFQ